jgi:hypothetical protein
MNASLHCRLRRLVYEGDLMKTTKSKGGATRSQLRSFYLFDHLLVYGKCMKCDKKGEKLVFKGRLPTDGLVIKLGTGRTGETLGRDGR